MGGIMSSCRCTQVGFTTASTAIPMVCETCGGMRYVASKPEPAPAGCGRIIHPEGRNEPWKCGEFGQLCENCLTGLALCESCGEPMPEGETMFNYHGYSGPCPKPPLNSPRPSAPEPVAGLSEAEKIAQAVAEGYPDVDQTCAECKTVFKNYHHLVRCASATCPMKDAKGSLLEQFAAEVKSVAGLEEAARELEWIIEQSDHTFAECTLAEEIMRRVRLAGMAINRAAKAHQQEVELARQRERLVWLEAARIAESYEGRDVGRFIASKLRAKAGEEK